MKTIALVLLLSLGVILEKASAQVIPDSTVGTTVFPMNVINGGTRSGNNLFHSFSQFSIPTGGSAIFNNAPDIQTIFSRVTGSTISNIDGLIQTQGNANLFLMNPNGIIFGPNAKLAIGGSFVGTTASSIQFANGVQFDAKDLSPNPLLTVSVPIGLQMGNNPAPITVQGMGHRLAANNFIAPYQPYAPYSGLQVQPNKTLALLGGNINFIGGIIQAPNGRIEIGSVAQSGLVGLRSIDQGFTTSYTDLNQLGKIQFRNRSSLEVAGIYPGNIHIQGRTIDLREGSVISGSNYGTAPGGTIALSATESMTMSGAIPQTAVRTGIRQNAFNSGSVGDIVLQSPNILVETGTSIYSLNYGFGSGGLVKLNTENLTINGFAPQAPQFSTQVGTLTVQPKGLGGRLMVSAQNIFISDGGFLGTTTFVNGQVGGEAEVNADHILVQGRSPLGFSSAIGAYGLGNSGMSGNLTVNTGSLAVRDGGLVGTSSISNGNAGNLVINARESIVVSGYGGPDAYESTISSSVSRPTPAYQQLFDLAPIPRANGGSVEINTPSLIIRDGGNVNVSNYGIGNAGILKVNAGAIKLDNDAIIGAITSNGEGGNIRIQADLIELRNQSNIATLADGAGNTGDAGNIDIIVNTIVGLGNSDIRADATQGKGGNVHITTQGIFGLMFRSKATPLNDINASSKFGVNGTVHINSFGLDPSSGLVKLPGEIVDSSRLIANQCATAKENSFIRTGRGGMPQNPLQKIRIDRSWQDLRTPIASQSAPVAFSKIQNPKSKIVEASQIQIDRDGSIALTNESPIALPITQTCAAIHS